MRLAVATRRRTPPKSVADDKHKHVAEQALDWQQAAGYAVFWEMGAAGHEDDEGRVYALAGQMASAGEQLSLAHAAAVEVALWREVRAKADHDPEQEMCMRAMAEAQCLFVIGTGHALANVAVRALALDHGLRAGLSKRLRRGSVSPGFRPFSQDREDWVSLNPHDLQRDPSRRAVERRGRRDGADRGRHRLRGRSELAGPLGAAR